MRRRAPSNKFSTAPIVDPNTFIGGVGADYITSAQDFADITNLDVTEILGFSIDVNDNVSFRVETNYAFSGSNRFRNILSLTYYIDLDGYMAAGMTWNCFVDNDNCLHVYFPACPSFGSSSPLSFSRFDGLKYINVEGVVNMQKRGFLAQSALLKVLIYPTAYYSILRQLTRR